jgi:hypothetical protein
MKIETRQQPNGAAPEAAQQQTVTPRQLKKNMAELDKLPPALKRANKALTKVVRRLDQTSGLFVGESFSCKKFYDAANRLATLIDMYGAAVREWTPPWSSDLL